MEREEIEEKLKPLDWYQVDYRDEVDIRAGAGPLNFWYTIFMYKGKYALAAENEEGTINVTIGTGIETVEEAKNMAWDDFISEVLDLFK